jgi:hypothetical protein
MLIGMFQSHVPRVSRVSNLACGIGSHNEDLAFLGSRNLDLARRGSKNGLILPAQPSAGLG